MGKFAGLFDLPGGEQMLISVVTLAGKLPQFQIVTEIYDEQVSMMMPVTQDKEKLEKMTHAEVKKLAHSSLDNITRENLLVLRKTIVLEFNKMKTAPPAAKAVEKA